MAGRLAVLKPRTPKGAGSRFCPHRMGPNVNALADCTLPEKILLAANQLEESGQSPFSAEALIVAAWQHYPRPLA